MIKKSVLGAIFSAIAAITVMPANAQVEPYPLEYWAVRSAMRNVAVSPDGKYVAFMKIASKRGNPIIEVYESGDLTKDPFRAGGKSLEVTNFNWVGPTQMIVGFRGQVSKRISGFNQGVYRGRIALLDVETGKFTPLDNPTGGSGSEDAAFSISFVNILPDRPDEILVSYREFNPRKSIRPTSYYRFNLKSRSKQLVLKGNSEWFGIRFDKDGYPRTALSFDASTSEFLYGVRDQGDGDWTIIYRLSQDSFEDFNIEALVPGSDDLIYVTAHNGRDKVGLWTFNVRTKQFVDLVFSHPEVDVTGVVRHSNTLAQQGVPVGAGWYKDKFHREFFDDRTSQIEGATLAQLEGIVPNAEFVRITSRSMDGNTLVINNIGMKDPGTFYLLHNGRFQKLGGIKPLLEASNLAERRYIQYPARDGRMIPGFVHVPQGKPPFPLVVVPHGGPFVQETVIFDEWAQLLANNGYAVLQPQYRGSQGYGLEFYQSAFINGGKGGYSMQDDKDDGALYLAQQGLVDRDRIAMFGWSYGGYAALIAASRTPQIHQCVIAGAAVADNKQQVGYYRAQIRGSQRTEQLRFWDDSINPIEVADQVNVPMLIIHGSVDQRVPPEHSRRYTDVLDSAGKDYEYIELKGADHFSNTLFYRHKIKLYENMIRFLKEDCGPGGL